MCFAGISFLPSAVKLLLEAGVGGKENMLHADTGHGVSREGRTAAGG